MCRLLTGICGILLTLLWGCGSAPEVPPLRTENQTDEIAPVQILPKRFEQLLFGFSKESFSEDTLKMYREFGSFPDLFTSRIIRVGSKNMPLFRENLLGFIQDPDIRQVFTEVQRQYSTLDQEIEDLSLAFRRYKTIFPDSIVPQVITMVSGFNYNVVVDDSSLAIGLDMYLGDSCRFYEWLALPKYKIDRMNRTQLVPDAIRGYLLSNFVIDNEDNDLVTRMINQGRIIYFMQQLLPTYSEARILAYTNAQLNWCNENEGKIWSHFIDKKLFYSSDLNDELAYLNDGPFTKGFPEDAPARIGVWLGYSIVKSYMKNHEDVSLEMLMANKDAHALFNTSGYKPVRS